MASSAAPPVWYVYGIVPASLSPSTLPSGLDDADVVIERRNGDRAAALVSVLDGERYAEAPLESSSGDVNWLSPRAVAHDRVLTWASDLGPVVPFPMFSLFSGREAVDAMLSERSAQLASLLDRL
ncbi:MAG TPA: GvpL/GvpF family gas vesicle protein, partial [Gemmatimonadaceae bacterium]